MDAVRLCMQFGLTQQEAEIYIALQRGGQYTGYEMAKLTGISRSNAYTGLSNLVEKGGAWLIDGKPAKFQGVPISEFCENVIRNLSLYKVALEEVLPIVEKSANAYITLKGEDNIRNKIETVISKTKTHIYLSMPEKELSHFLPSLRDLSERKCKIVVITNQPVDLPKATVYIYEEQPEAIRVISDTRYALTGNVTGNTNVSCLYSDKSNLVELLRESIKNEIKLIQLTGRSPAGQW